MFNEMLRQFAPLTSISQGSAATHFRFDGIFNDGITAIFFLILIVNKFRKSVNI